MSYVVDTNIFNKLVDGILRLKDLPSDVPYIATHIQIEEINNPKDIERRTRLLLIFAEMRPQMVPTESSVWCVSRWGKGKFGGGIRYKKLKQNLDARNKLKYNNANDILIAEIAIANGYTLFTVDYDIASVTEKHGGKVRYLSN